MHAVGEGIHGGVHGVLIKETDLDLDCLWERNINGTAHDSNNSIMLASYIYIYILKNNINYILNFISFRY